MQMTRQRAAVGVLLLVLGILAACAPTDDTPVPTLLVLPSATPEQPTEPPLPSPTEPATTSVAAPPPFGISATPSATSGLTLTATETPFSEPTPTVTASLTITPTPTNTHTPTPLPTEVEGPLLELARLALSATVVTPNYALLTTTPTGFAPVPSTLCIPPVGGFGAVYTANISLNTILGCPVGGNLNYSAVIQRFERGYMLYLATVPPAIYVVSDSGTWTQYADTFVEGIDPVSGGEQVPPNLFEPIRGFGKVWRTNPTVRADLGWATTTETGTTATVLAFERGQMIAVPLYGQVFSLGASGQSLVVAGSP